MFNDSLSVKITKSSKILKFFVLIFLWSSISLIRLSVPYLIGFLNRMWSWLSFHFYIFAFIWHICSNFWFLFMQVTPWLYSKESIDATMINEQSDELSRKVGNILFILDNISYIIYIYLKYNSQFRNYMRYKDENEKDEIN